MSCFAVSLFLVASAARADALMWDDGGVALEAYFTYPPSTADIAAMTADIQVANEMIFDAADGQM
jgi:hypothetical protein